MATTNTWDQVVSKITGVANRGAFSKTYTPSTSKQTANGSAGYYSSITTVCNAVSLSGNAATSQVLTGRTFYTTSLTRQTGTMANRGNLNWSGSNTTYSVPAGYYSGGTLDSRPSYTNGYNAGVTAGKNTALSIKTTTVNAGTSAGTANFPTWEGGTKNVQYRRASYSISGTIHAIFMYGSNTSYYPVLYCRAANMIFTAKSATGHCKFICSSPAYVNNTGFALPLYEKSGPGSTTFTAIIYYSS